MPSRGVQSTQYGMSAPAPAPAASSGAYPRPAPSGQVPMFPYSGQHPTQHPMTYQPGYSQAVTGPTAAPPAGAMTGPMATGASGAQVGAFNTPRRPGELPEWAQEPVRRPLVMLALWFTLSSIGTVRPGWMAIIGALLTVVAGTVGRAQDARRWNRLQRGGTSPSDSSRMWAMTPWYLLRSLISVGFAFLLAIGTAIVLLALAYAVDAPSDDFILGSFPPVTRFYIIYFTIVALYLLVMWLAPWGTATRRGGAHMLKSITPSNHSRRNLVMGLLGVGAMFFILTFARAMPLPDLTPFGN